MPAGLEHDDQMFYVGEAPWHRLGVKLDGPATAEEAIEAAGLGWEVAQEPVYIRRGSGGLRGLGYEQIPEKMAVVRQDTRRVLGVLSERFSPLQNRDAFAFFDGVVAVGEAVYHTAGSLHGGKRVWILAQLPGDMELGDGDLIRRFILLANSHDGSTAVTMKLTPTRVVCMNTLEIALAKGGQTVRHRHTGDILAKIGETRDILGLADAYHQLLFRHIQRLADTRVTREQQENYVANVVGLDLSDPEQTRTKNARHDAFVNVLRLINEGMGQELPTAQGTAWGCYNAVTEYIDHRYPVRGAKGGHALVDDRRLDRSWFGPGQDLRQKAWDAAMELVPVTVHMGGQERAPEARWAIDPRTNETVQL